MTTISELSTILQQLLTTQADTIAKTTGFIQRQRQITGAGFAQTLILGASTSQKTTCKHYHHQSVQAGLQVSVQALDQRFTSVAVDFMRGMLEATLTHAIRGEYQTNLLPQFNGVYITDATRLDWKHCPLKLTVRLDLQSGGFQATLSDIVTHDQKTGMIDQPLPVGALHLADLGFFKLSRFQSWTKNGVYWLSRYKIGTRLHTLAGHPIHLASLLSDQDSIHMPVQVGCGRNALQAYLVAGRLPPEAFAKRMKRLKEQARLDQRPLSVQQLELAQWTIYLTNVADLNFTQAHILGRTRWQIELVFKLWKSHANLMRSRSANPIRQLCEGYAKLISVIIAHWSLIVAGWQYDTISMTDALHIFYTQVSFLQRCLLQFHQLTAFFLSLQHALRHAPPRQKRKNVRLAFQLWGDFATLFP
jgi:hypothetical protein